MGTESGIFLSKIHNEAYLQPYLDKPADADSMISTAGRETESLSGVWNYHPDPYDTGLRAGWYNWQETDKEGRPVPWDFDFEHWPTMQLPAVWNTEDEKLFYNESSVVFTRTFRYRSHGERFVKLRFGAVYYRCFVFLNGTYIGFHDGGSTPFFFDITEALKEMNRIVVVVEAVRSKERVPMSNTDWFNYGGIFRDIELVRLPSVYIKDFSLSLVPDDTFSRLSFSYQLGGESAVTAPETAGGKAAPPLTLTIPELNIEENISPEKGSGKITINAQPELWSPKNPRLYDVSLLCGEDMLHDRIGFRQIKINGNRVEINGTPAFLRGVCAHEDSIQNGRALTEEEIRETLTAAKEMNCNFIRLAHYPHSEQVSMIADEMGIMLWEEIPVYWAIAFDNEKTLSNARNQLAELIRRDRNRASVIIWSVGNENPDSDARLSFMKQLADTARKEDGTRPVSAACLVDHERNRIADRLADHLDIIGINEYIGWYTRDFAMLPDLFENSKPNKPVIITEFGAGAVAGHHGSTEDLFTEENQKFVYEKQVETFKKIPYIAGTTPWILYDFRSPKRTNRFQQGYNRKGLLSADKKKKKLAFFVMRDFYRDITKKEKREHG